MRPHSHPPDTIVIAGPTGSGKTALALRLAKRLDGEIISCDSRQIYKHLAAGTDKPLGEWLMATRQGKGNNTNQIYVVEGIPYHLVDMLDPTETFSAGDFVRLARPIETELTARRRTMVMAGGTGMYLKAYWEGLDALPPRDEAVRARLAEESLRIGRAALHGRLTRIDPAVAASIPANNLQRVIRALEVFELTGKPISSFWSRDRHGGRNQSSKAAPLMVGLWWEKRLLEERIRQRCEQAFPAMLSEVRRLLDRGCPPDAPGLKTLGYPEARECLEGRRSQEEALSLYIRSVSQYAKRQRTWFKKQPVRWIEIKHFREEEPERWVEQVLRWSLAKDKP